MGPSQLIRRQAELEYGVAIPGNVIRLTPANSVDVPRVTVARHAKGDEMLIREDLSDAEFAAFSGLGAERLFLFDEDEIRMLELTCGTGYRVVDCCWYCITRIPMSQEFPDVVLRDDRFIIEQDSQIVAKAWSSQDSATAAEVEVATVPAFRRRGYARQVVAAWVHHVRREGKIAYYSHLTTNAASRALVANLGGVWFADMREFF